MTRHKQQLLQEQEMLLEQLSQRVEDRDEVKESEKMNIDNEPQKTSSPVIKDSSDSSSSPFLLPTSTAPSEKPRQPLTVDTYTTEESNKVSRVQHSRPPSENHRLLTFYKDKSPRETYDHHHSVAGVKRYRNQYEASEGQVTRREDPGYRTVDRYLFGRLQVRLD